MTTFLKIAITAIRVSEFILDLYHISVIFVDIVVGLVRLIIRIIVTKHNAYRQAMKEAQQAHQRHLHLNDSQNLSAVHDLFQALDAYLEYADYSEQWTEEQLRLMGSEGEVWEESEVGVQLRNMRDDLMKTLEECSAILKVNGGDTVAANNDAVKPSIDCAADTLTILDPELKDRQVAIEPQSVGSDALNAVTAPFHFAWRFSGNTYHILIGCKPVRTILYGFS